MFFSSVPDNIEDEIVGSITFAENFTSRYGHIHPAFYQGTLEDAIKEACAKPAKDVRSHFVILRSRFIFLTFSEKNPCHLPAPRCQRLDERVLHPAVGV